MDLQGSSALVSGGASGLGAATAHALRDAGARVVVADLEGAREKARALGGDVVFVPTDVTVEQDVVAAVEAAVDLGPLRAAVSCAGMADQRRLIGSRGTLDLDNVRRVMETNFVGTVALLAHAAEAMSGNELVDGDRGVVVMVASIAGLDSASIAYGGSKAAVAGITLAAARELAGRAVRVVTVAPGLFETPMLAGMSAGARNGLADGLLQPARPGRPEEFALLVRHIVENPMLNGETIRLDGAVRAHPTGDAR